MAEYVKRDDALNAIERAYGTIGAYERVECLPAADVAPVVHGEWKFDINPYSHRWSYKCTACGGWATDETDYCPNCGAKMDGGSHAR